MCMCDGSEFFHIVCIMFVCVGGGSESVHRCVCMYVCMCVYVCIYVCNNVHTCACLCVCV